MNWIDFGSEKMPLRASRGPELTSCSLSAVIRALTDADRGSNVAADTGSAVHRAALHYHQKTEARDAVALMREGLVDYPFADLDDAEKQFLCYADDPRNQNADIVLLEEEIVLVLEAAEDDPSKAPIVIRGRLDQVRREQGALVLWDIKTGAKSGPDMLTHYAVQQATYQLGAAKLFKEPVLNSGIIRTKDYAKNRRGETSGPVFWRAPWSVSGCKQLLEPVKWAVAEIRRGRPLARPGEHCRWCVGLERCLPMLKEIER